MIDNQNGDLMDEVDEVLLKLQDANRGKFRNFSDLEQLTKKNEDDAGLDLCANLQAPIEIYTGEEEIYLAANEGEPRTDVILPARSRIAINTTVNLAIPPGHVGLAWTRSGMSKKHGIEVGAGCIDASYRGDIQIVLYNHSDINYVVRHGDKVAQLLTVPVNLYPYIEVDQLNSTSRGTAGFGSTGR